MIYLKIIFSYLPAEIRFGPSYIKTYYTSIFWVWLSNYLSFEQIHKFLGLHKELRNHNGLYLSKNDLSGGLNNSSSKKKLLKVTTGGTTGRPFEFFVGESYHRKFVGYRHALWAQWGFHRNLRQISLNYSFKNNQDLFFYNYRENSLDINISKIGDLNESNLEEIEKWGAHYLIGYPSTLNFFRERYESLGGKLKKLELIISGSEKLYEWQRFALADYFKVPVKCWYGMSESAAFAFECARAKGYHFLPNVSLVELINSENRRTYNKGEIVVSSNSNIGTKFLKYRTGDIGLKLTNNCPSCGLKLQNLDEIDGRSQDYLQDGAGNKYYISSINTHTLSLESVVGFQFIQYENLDIDVIFIPRDNRVTKAKNQIIKLVEEKLSNNLVINIMPVKSLEMTNRGKTPLILKKNKRVS